MKPEGPQWEEYWLWAAALCIQIGDCMAVSYGREKKILTGCQAFGVTS